MKTYDKKSRLCAKGIAAAITLLVVVCHVSLWSGEGAMAAAAQKPEHVKTDVLPQSEKIRRMEGFIHDRINEIRQEHGLQTLKENKELSRIARRYSRQMSRKDFFAHEDPAGNSMVDRLREAKMVYRMAAENIFKVYNMDSPEQVMVKGWMDSPSHRKNILQEGFVETGIGIWRDGKTYYATQLFFTPQTD